MKSKILNLLALIFLVIWAVEFFIYDLVVIANIFLALATLVFIVKILKEK